MSSTTGAEPQGTYRGIAAWRDKWERMAVVEHWAVLDTDAIRHQLA